MTMLLPGNLDHVGIASDRLGERDWPMLVHNIGQGAREESVMPQFALTGRYRWRLG